MLNFSWSLVKMNFPPHLRLCSFALKTCWGVCSVLDPEFILNPLHGHNPSQPSYLTACPLDNIFSATLASLLFSDHSKHAAASGPWHILIPLLWLSFTEKCMCIPPSLLLRLGSNVTQGTFPGHPIKQQHPLSPSTHTLHPLLYFSQ